ncbi:ABC transporter ATP-binding protein [Salinispirillum sp. LH 10-3-1]|uniref:ABC transporter ATP-binding protein n=1 Tax=Salinispirillum sp. LH 10-3-1 TaxID=2952525 RepID=A0AB38YBE5_9GAMM
MNDVVLQCEGLTKEYQVGPETVRVFDDLALTINAGDMVSIVGASGSGKSTLLHLMAGLDLPTAGRVSIKDRDLAAISERERSALRNEYLGFVFQFHHLLHEFTALDNVLMPARISRKPTKEDIDYAMSLLDQVGVAHRAKHKPSELSGGERQRVAIARSLMNKPRLVLMDEPTGNLDSSNSAQVQRVILGLNEVANCSFVLVTHNAELAEPLTNRYRLQEGQLVRY